MENSRKRLLILEYKLLEEINDKNIFVVNNGELTIESRRTLNSSAFDAFKKLKEKKLIDENGITEKGKNYLKNFPRPKQKFENTKKTDKDDLLVLTKLENSLSDWTPSNKITKNREILFNLVRLGYAVGMKNRDGIKLHKNEILQEKSLYKSNEKNKYHFKITKKGKDKLKRRSI